MPIISTFSGPKIILLAKLLIQRTCIILSDAQFSQTDGNEAVLEGAFRLIESYKHNTFDFRDAHAPESSQERLWRKNEEEQLRQTMVATGVELFSNDTQENIATSIQEDLRNFYNFKGACEEDTKKFFNTLLLKLNAL